MRLRGQTPIERERIEGTVQAVAEHLDEIDAVSVAAGRGGFVFAARAAAVAAGGGGVGVGGRHGGLGARAGHGRRRHGDPAAVGLRRGVVG